MTGPHEPRLRRAEASLPGTIFTPLLLPGLLRLAVALEVRPTSLRSLLAPAHQPACGAACPLSRTDTSIWNEPLPALAAPTPSLHRGREHHRLGRRVGTPRQLGSDATTSTHARRRPHPAASTVPPWAPPVNPAPTRRGVELPGSRSCRAYPLHLRQGGSRFCRGVGHAEAAAEDLAYPEREARRHRHAARR